MGLATQERGSRSIQILSGLSNPDYVYTGYRRPRFSSVLCFALKDAMLTQRDFYLVFVHAKTRYLCICASTR